MLGKGVLGGPTQQQAHKQRAWNAQKRGTCFLTLSMKKAMPLSAHAADSSLRPRSMKPKWRAPAPRNAGTCTFISQSGKGVRRKVVPVGLRLHAYSIHTAQETKHAAQISCCRQQSCLASRWAGRLSQALCPGCDMPQ